MTLISLPSNGNVVSCRVSKATWSPVALYVVLPCSSNVLKSGVVYPLRLSNANQRRVSIELQSMKIARCTDIFKFVVRFFVF